MKPTYLLETFFTYYKNWNAKLICFLTKEYKRFLESHQETTLRKLMSARIQYILSDYQRLLPAITSNYSMPFVVSLTTYILLLVVPNNQLNDGDTLWHIVLGQNILSSWQLPEKDNFSFTYPNHPYWTNSWLSDVILAFAYNVGGYAGVVTLTAASIAITFMLLEIDLSRRLPDVLGLALCVVAFVLMSPHILSRPHVLVFPLIVLWTQYLMTAEERGQTPSYVSLFVLFFWTNMHGSFILAYVLSFPVLLFSIFKEGFFRNDVFISWLYFYLGMLLASMIGPYGMRPVMTAFGVISLGDILFSINEWRSRDFSTFSSFEAAILIFIGSVSTGRIKINVCRILILLGLIHMALSHIRNADYLAIVGVISLTQPLSRTFIGEYKSLDVKKIVPILIFLSTIVTCITYIPGFVHPTNTAYPIEAIKSIKLHNIAGNVLNDYNFSGALILNNQKVFIDSRTEFYPREHFMRYMKIINETHPDQLRDFLNTNDIKWTMLNSNFPINVLISEMPEWSRVYKDEFATVFVRKPSN